jgi:hypothetical protein
MADEPNETPHIFVDSDWKEQARREKEELDRQTREEPRPTGLPDPSLGELVQMIVIQASLGFGGFQDPNSGQTIPPNLAVAKHYIDLLDLLLNKTRNNLDENEKAIIEGTLHELRMAFVQLAGVGTAPSPAQPQK